MNRVERYRECANRGMSMGDTARLYGVTHEAVRDADRRHSLGFKRRQVNQYSDVAAYQERVRNLAAQGKNRREISVITKVPLNTITRWCREWNIRFAAVRGRKKPMMEMIGPLLSEQEADDLNLFRRKKYTFRDAFVAMGRPDLLQYLPEKKA